MKIGSFNVNGVNGRLLRLLEWLAEARPDIACLQEIKTSDPRFPIEAIQAAGYGAVWHGQPSHHGVAILARGVQPVEVRRGLPSDDSDGQARYIEAQVTAQGRGFVVASVYLPNGNPQPGPKFDYKLAWFVRFNRVYTFWVNDQAFRRNAGFRMDFLLASPNLAGRIVASEVDASHRGRDKPSDHAPVWVTLA